MSNIFIRIVIVDVMKSFKDKLACMLYHEYMLCFTCHWRECFIILTLLSLSHYRPHSHAILAGARNQSADLDSGPTGTAYKEKFAQDQKLRKERNKSRESVSESHSKRTPSDEDDHDENGMYINIDVRSIPCTCIYCHCSRVLNELIRSTTGSTKCRHFSELCGPDRFRDALYMCVCYCCCTCVWYSQLF